MTKSLDTLCSVLHIRFWNFGTAALMHLKMLPPEGIYYSTLLGKWNGELGIVIRLYLTCDMFRLKYISGFA